MQTHEIVNRLMFNYNDYDRSDIENLCLGLPKKIVRWIGMNHPDNKTRKIFFELTNVKIGDAVVINPNFVVSDGYESLLTIGDRVAISPNVTVVCDSGPNNSSLQHTPYVKDNLICAKPVIIGSDVWIGSNVVILPGVKIGRRTIIGAGAVVSRDIPDDVVAAGSPARVIRNLV